MAIFELEQFSFTYPNETEPALNHVSMNVDEGEFLLLCGMSGCGKTTLLRQLKPALTPHGTHSGIIRFSGRPLQDWDLRTQAAQIGFVMQSPESQIVTDKVWHELSFGLESLGFDSQIIRLRTAEMASFFGIEAWFEKDVSGLSGGQKQLLNLASIMAMQPRVLLLDEPTSQLDPIAAADFLASVKKINTELGVAVIIVEQRLQDVFALADRVVVLNKGKILTDAPPRKAGADLIEKRHPMAEALPAPMKIFCGVQSGPECPITVRDGRKWLNNRFHEKKPKQNQIQETYVKPMPKKDAAVQLKDCWFSYGKGYPDVVKNLSLNVSKGELFCILGGNGTGKTTALSLIAGLNKPYRGKIKVNGRIAMLPQYPQSLFLKSTVEDDLAEVLPPDEKKQIAEIAKLVEIEHLLHRHPYDLSGGEQQRAALGKVLLTKPDILLLDEPTKGLDAFFKITFAAILDKLITSGITVIMVSHDIEFCAEHADTCALFFNGNLVAGGPAREFFAGNSFYTTAANRMARDWFPNAVTNGDVIALCRKNPE